MASANVPARTTPAWYRRWSPAVQRIAVASDRVPVLPLRAGPELRAVVTELPTVLASGQCATVEPVVQRIADGVCRALGVRGVRVRVQRRRPHNAGGELHGIYVPVAPPARPEVTLWMLTAKRGDVVKPRTFLRTLLHELCHHFDYTWLRLRDSPHTQGFYQRESSLFAALDGRALDSR
jgi:hypothetical protein